MMYRFIKLFGVLSTLLLISASSVDYSDYDIDDEISDQELCVFNVKSNCIDLVCLTSESRDCPEDCEKMAKRKCVPSGVVYPTDNLIYEML